MSVDEISESMWSFDFGKKYDFFFFDFGKLGNFDTLILFNNCYFSYAGEKMLNICIFHSHFRFTRQVR